MPATDRSDGHRPPAPGVADRVALIAGSGRLAPEIAATLIRSGHAPYVLVIDGEGEEKDFAGAETARVPIEDFPDLVEMLKSRRITHVVMAGGVSRRPDPRRMRFNFSLLRLLLRFLLPLARGDDSLLRAVIGHLEANGFHVIGAQQIVPDLLMEEGRITRTAPTRADRRDIEAARAAAVAIGALDIGQAAVAIGGRVVAVEDIGGTDALIARVSGMRNHGRLAGKTGGVLVKCAKPGQEMRADLPAMGPATVEAAHAAGLAGIALDAGRAFILERERAVALADALGLFIIGLPEERRDADG